MRNVSSSFSFSAATDMFEVALKTVDMLSTYKFWKYSGISE